MKFSLRQYMMSFNRIKLETGLEVSITVPQKQREKDMGV